METFDEKQVLKKVTFSVWKELFKIIATNGKDVFFLLFFGIILSFVEVLTLPLNEFAVSDLIGQPYEQRTLIIFIFLSIAQIISFALSVFGFLRFGARLEANVRYQLKALTFENLQKLPFSYYDNTKQGWIMARMTSDTNRLARIVSWGILDVTWGIFSMIFSLGILYFREWRLALIITALLPFLVAIAFAFRKKVLILNRRSRFHNSQLTGLFNESFLGVKTTKSLGVEQELKEEFEKEAYKMKKVSVSAATVSGVFSSVLLGGAYSIVALMMALGGQLVIADSMFTVGTLYLFIRACMNFFEPVLNLTQFISDLQIAQASAERVIQLVKEVPSVDDSPEIKDVYGDLFNKKVENWEEIKGDVEFRNVNFFYNENEIILDDFNLKVVAGQSVALVGHTGSGKTTIVNLFARFYEPRSGQILIDGVDYKKRSLSWLHSRLGYVLQMPELFSTTIKENIRYGKLDASDEEVIKASRAVGLHNYVVSLKDGYDTFVGETGNLLSIGQKQLIAFARAILVDPKILILDEATSSIDSAAEVVIQKATKELLKGRTSFIVAHRLSTIVNCDLIVLLDKGKILEQGTHNELIALRGHYFDLYKNQFIEERSNKTN